MELENLFKDRSKEAISAFAYNMGRMLDEAVKFSSDNAIKENQELKAKVFNLRQELSSLDSLANMTVGKLVRIVDRHFDIEILKGE